MDLLDEHLKGLLNAHSLADWQKSWNEIENDTSNNMKSPSAPISPEFTSLTSVEKAQIQLLTSPQFPHLQCRQLEYDPLPLSPILDHPSLQKTQHSFCETSQQRSRKNVPITAFRKVNIDGKRFFECTWKNCTKRFTRLATNAQVHWSRHGQVKAYYVCDICSMGFERMCDMRRHVNSSHQ